MATWRVMNGDVIEERGFAGYVEAARFGWDIVRAFVGATQANVIRIERVDEPRDEPQNEIGVPDLELSTGIMGTGTATHLIWRAGGEQKWHGRCRAVTRHAKGTPHIQQTGGKPTCKACLG